MEQKVIHRYFAHKDEKKFCHIYKTKVQVSCYGRQPMFEIELQEHEQGEYYGWKDKETKEVIFIYNSLLLLNMCFGYGYEKEEKTGRGRMVRLKLVSQKPC